MAEEWQGVPASSGTMDLSRGDGGGRSRSQRLDPYRWPALVPHTDTGRSASGCNRSRTTILSSLSAYTDRRNRPAQVPIHGRGSGLSGFTGNQSVKDVSERSVNDVVELYTFRPAICCSKFSALATEVKTLGIHQI